MAANLSVLRSSALGQAALVFFLSLAVFFWSPNRQLEDSTYSLLVSEQLLRHGNFYLDAYFVPPLDEAKYPGLAGREYPYMIEQSGGHLFYFYPPGSSILSVPYVAVLHGFGISVENASGQYDRFGELALQGGLAALLMAVLATCVFATARSVTASLAWSLAITIGTVLGTQVWSTASRVLWSHTWGIVLLSLAILYLVGEHQQRWRIRPIILASLMAWMYFVRPTYAVSCLVVSVYVLLRLRSIALGVALTCLAWLGAFVAYSEHYFGRLLPQQYFQDWGFDSRPSAVLVALAGHLFSPSRGFLVFTPVLFVVAYWLVRHRRTLPMVDLVVVAAAALALQLLLVSSWQIWWGGHSYGPRLLTDVVPWLALLSISAVTARIRAPKEFRRHNPTGLAVAAILLGVSVWIHWRGAFAVETTAWNARPIAIELAPDRVWDWSHPQFLAGLVPD